MKNILDTIADHARERVAEQKKLVSPADMRARAEVMNADTRFPFERALSGEDISFICECKKASPSKGVIAEEFPYVQIAQEYERAGADCISVLTEPKWFLGSEEYLAEISESVDIPCLRKDFVIDEYMIYQAKDLGAAAVLLICALLDEGRLREYISLCGELGISALVEAHDEKEMDAALKAGARIIGVNNRDLKDFSVDVGNSARLRSLAPKSTIFVAESGIKTPEDVAAMRDCGANAVLVGEALMRAVNKKAMLDSLRGIA
jgi:indole-3-glycerol phosphate synthase